MPTPEIEKLTEELAAAKSKSVSLQHELDIVRSRRQPGEMVSPELSNEVRRYLELRGTRVQAEIVSQRARSALRKAEEDEDAARVAVGQIILTQAADERFASRSRLPMIIVEGCKVIDLAIDNTKSDKGLPNALGIKVTCSTRL